MEKGSRGEDEEDTWGLDWERYETKTSETMVVKTRADGIENNAHTDLAVKFRDRVLRVSLLLSEVRCLSRPLRACCV